MKKVLSLFVVLSSLGCVTTHLGDTAESSQGYFALSCATGSIVQEERFVVATCTVENLTDKWLDVEVSSVKIRPEVSGVKISTARETTDFVRAYSERNPENPFGALVVGGARHANKGTEVFGDVSLSSPQFGPEHLLGGSFRVPAGLPVDKHLLFERDPNVMAPPRIEICLARPYIECLNLQIYGQRGRF